MIRMKVVFGLGGFSGGDGIFNVFESAEFFGFVIYHYLRQPTALL
jgi:hypothetical protein